MSQETEPTVNSLSPPPPQRVEPPPAPQAGDPMPQPPQEPPPAQEGNVSLATRLEEEFQIIVGVIGQDRALQVVLQWLDPVDHEMEILEAELLQNGSLAPRLEVIREQYLALLKEFGNDVGVDMVLSCLGLPPLVPENHTTVSTKESHNTDEVGLPPPPSPQAGDPMPLPPQEPPPQEGNVEPHAATRVIEEEFEGIVELLGEDRALEVVLQFLDPRDDEMKILEAELLQNGNLAARLNVIREQYLAILSDCGNDVGVDMVLSCLGLPEPENHTTVSPKESRNTNDQRRRKIRETEEEAVNNDTIVTELRNIDDPPTLHYVVKKIGPSKLQDLEQTWNNLNQEEMKQSGSFPENLSQTEAGLEVELSKALCEDSMEQPKSKGA